MSEIKVVKTTQTHCDKCRQEKSPLHFRFVWIEGKGGHFVRICDGCIAAITVATAKMMAEVNAAKGAQ